MIQSRTQKETFRRNERYLKVHTMIRSLRPNRADWLAVRQVKLVVADLPRKQPRFEGGRTLQSSTTTASAGPLNDRGQLTSSCDPISISQTGRTTAPALIDKHSCIFALRPCFDHQARYLRKRCIPYQQVTAIYLCLAEAIELRRCIRLLSPLSLTSIAAYKSIHKRISKPKHI
jgi:hypothetical protein